ncbi:MAG: hypothetical protein Q8O46_04285 [bacterium]|nr:hypothetical protein [bacterium]
MIYLFSGDDAKKKCSSYEKFMESVSRKTETFFVNRNNFDEFQIENFCSGSNLFFGYPAIFFENIFDREETEKFVLTKLELMQKSQNIFVFLEGKLSKLILDAFKKSRAELNIFELPKAKKEKFDNFLLAGAFGVRDKLHLWIYFRQAVDLGVGMEELVGVLFWKAKDMLLKKNFAKFSKNELENFVSKISYLLPEARKERADAEAVFEQFLLEVL